MTKRFAYLSSALVPATFAPGTERPPARDGANVIKRPAMSGSNRSERLGAERMSHLRPEDSSVTAAGEIEEHETQERPRRDHGALLFRGAEF